MLDECREFCTFVSELVCVGAEADRLNDGGSRDETGGGRSRNRSQPADSQEDDRGARTFDRGSRTSRVMFAQSPLLRLAQCGIALWAAEHLCDGFRSSGESGRSVGRDMASGGIDG